jgi:long-subunit fatty acid transport protein
MNRYADLVYRISIAAFLCFLFMICSGFLTSAFAQELQRIEIPSSLNPVGSGARALGMGGAFIAVADDATAASWNPGGLIQLETPEVSMVGAYFDRAEDNTFGTNHEASGEESISEKRINYLSAAYPFSFWGHNMIASVNYQNLYDFTREWNFPLMQASGNLSLNQNVDYRQEGSLSALGIAYCVQITPEFSFGLTLNFWKDGLYPNEWEQNTFQTGSGIYVGNPFIFESKSCDKYSFSGFNINLGILWRVNRKVTIGAVVKTPFEADLRHESTFNSFIHYPGVPAADSTTSIASAEDETLDMPMSFGIGFAYRFSDEFTASIDIYRTEWDDYVLTDSTGNRTSPISGKYSGDSDIDPTHQVRLGAEYLFIKPTHVIPLRGGIFYDPAPAEGSPDDFYGLSLGSGIAYRQFIFDIAYQYRLGNDVGTSILKNLNFSQDLDEHTIYSSMIIHF